ncbi:MAG: ABC transporter ATP-binding protein [Candidatus Omnitrophota bacterium]|jgi:lipoprotein-releasing system ATP-binding protein
MAIVTKDLSRAYSKGHKKVLAVGDISVGIENGEVVAVVGPSGAGKSTFLHLLGGLDAPTSGSVLIDGVDIFALSGNERSAMRNRKIGFIFQFYHLLNEFTALENVILSGSIRGHVSGKERRGLKERAEGLLKEVGLVNRMAHRPGELSGGECQRVAIARALMNSPEILLCDEPTGNLDSKTSGSIYDLLLNLRARSNMTVVIVTHDENMSRRATRTIHMKDGRIA